MLWRCLILSNKWTEIIKIKQNLKFTTSVALNCKITSLCLEATILERQHWSFWSARSHLCCHLHLRYFSVCEWGNATNRSQIINCNVLDVLIRRKCETTCNLYNAQVNPGLHLVQIVYFRNEETKDWQRKQLVWEHTVNEWQI